MNKTILPLIIAFCLSWALPVSAQNDVAQIRQNVNLRTAKVIREVPSVTVEEFKSALDSRQRDYSIIDVRSMEEFAAGRIANAINVPRGRAEWGVPAVVRDSGRRIYVYCRSGNRSAYVVKMLLEVGYTDVVNVTGGFKAWLLAGFPYYNMHGESVLADTRTVKVRH